MLLVDIDVVPFCFQSNACLLNKQLA